MTRVGMAGVDATVVGLTGADLTGVGATGVGVMCARAECRVTGVGTTITADDLTFTSKDASIAWSVWCAHDVSCCIRCMGGWVGE
jgi:hypothetical protein